MNVSQLSLQSLEAFAAASVYERGAQQAQETQGDEEAGQRAEIGSLVRFFSGQETDGGAAGRCGAAGRGRRAVGPGEARPALAAAHRVADEVAVGAAAGEVAVLAPVAFRAWLLASALGRE